MIKISDLTVKDIGRMVKYSPDHGGFEKGILKSWNDRWIFVVYPGNNMEKAMDWRNYTAAATNPDKLDFIG